MEDQVVALVEQPNFGKIKDLKKSGLLLLADKLNLAVSSKMLKAQVLRVIVTHLVEDEKLEEECLGELEEESSDKVAILKLELETQLEMARLAADKQRLELQNQQKHLELAADKQRLELQNQTKHLELEAQLQLAEQQTRQLEIQQSMAENNNRLEQQRIAAGLGNTSNNPESTNSSSKYSKHVELPRFNEEDPEIFFLHFKKLAVSMNWPVDQWDSILQGQFKGKAQEVFASLPAENSFDLKFVQQSILNAYQQIPEAHRIKFRSLKRAHDQTISDFVRVKLNHFDRWIKALKIRV
ncbi:uncharacterized protein [Procambarus clarkii]|uniref:uncharacterized protein isoform X2 n=1 Tax=Procambarus clarkii TaxID=6728 RepID=UPI0037449000